LRSALLLFVLMIAQPMWADLAAIKAEPSADKRAAKALDQAGQTLNSIRDHLPQLSLVELKQELDEFRQAMDLTVDSLSATGKNPAKNPKEFKKTELTLRIYMRKLKTLEHDLNVEERPLIAPILQRVEQIQDDLVQGIMRKK
jgi:hypothetical protein